MQNDNLSTNSGANFELVQEQNLDSFEKKLLRQTQILKDCQSKNSLFSCFECQKIFECKIRTDYVDSVYESMSKGQGGNFDF